MYLLLKPINFKLCKNIIEFEDKALLKDLEADTFHIAKKCKKLKKKTTLKYPVEEIYKHNW